jgi:hypothetical protein
MSFNKNVLKELAAHGVNIEIQDGLRTNFILDLVAICVEKGSTLTINSKLLNRNTAIKIAELGGKNVTFTYNEELPAEVTPEI